MFAALFAPGNLPLLLECAARFSPLVEVTSPDLVTLDLRGLDRLLGSPNKIAAEIQRTVGVPAHIAVAANPDTAIYLSRSSTDVVIVPCGEESAHLAPLSLHLLGCPPDLGEVLDLWGLRTFGDFARLPALGIAARCGQEGVYWQRLAQGLVERQLRLPGETVRFVKELHWDHAIETVEPLLLVFGRMLVEFCVELQARSLATNEVCARMNLHGGSDHIVTVRLPVPMRNPKTLLKLLQCELEQRPAPAAVHAAQLELRPVAPKTTQEHLFTPSHPAPEQIELTLARVRRLVGAENVGTPELLDTHKPDSYRMRAFNPSLRNAQKTTRRPFRLALRRFRPPVFAQVTFHEQPIRIVSREIEGAIRQACGPWYSSGHWWLPDAWQHEEWDIALASGTLYKIFRDIKTECWFIEGNYD